MQTDLEELESWIRQRLVVARIWFSEGKFRVRLYAAGHTSYGDDKSLLDALHFAQNDMMAWGDSLR